MIRPEPTSVRYDYRYDYPSDEGLQSKFLYCIVEVPEMGAAGHLGVIEERCEPLPHEYREGMLWVKEPFSCPLCKAAV